MLKLNEVKVKKEHIHEGHPEEATDCPIAIALNKSICNDDQEWAEVSYGIIKILRFDTEVSDKMIKSGRKELAIIGTDDTLAKWIKDFDTPEMTYSEPSPFNISINWLGKKYGEASYKEIK